VVHFEDSPQVRYELTGEPRTSGALTAKAGRALAWGAKTVTGKSISDHVTAAIRRSIVNRIDLHTGSRARSYVIAWGGATAAATAADREAEQSVEPAEHYDQGALFRQATRNSNLVAPRFSRAQWVSSPVNATVQPSDSEQAMATSGGQTAGDASNVIEAVVHNHTSSSRPTKGSITGEGFARGVSPSPRQEVAEPGAAPPVADAWTAFAAWQSSRVDELTERLRLASIKEQVGKEERARLAAEREASRKARLKVALGSRMAEEAERVEAQAAVAAAVVVREAEKKVQWAAAAEKKRVAVAAAVAATVGNERPVSCHATEVVTVKVIEVASIPLTVSSTIYGTRALFGAPNADISALAVVAQPLLGTGAIQQPESLRGSVAVMQRGVISFTDKARKVAAAGAIALIIINTQNQAFVPDTDGLESADDITIPVVCIRQSDGAMLLKGLPSTVHVQFDGSEADEYASDIPLVCSPLGSDSASPPVPVRRRR
jgi:hypothetical protein